MAQLLFVNHRFAPDAIDFAQNSPHYNVVDRTIARLAVARLNAPCMSKARGKH